MPAALTRLDDELRGIVENLAEGLIPLAAWIADKVKNDQYRPREPAPWREQGESLTVKDTGAVLFFEELLAQSDAEASLVDRFREVLADRLRFSPLDDVGGWRTARALDADAKFGIVGSGNVLAAADGTPVTRAQFYAPYWELLRQTVSTAAPKSPADWEQLAVALMGDTSQAWPGNQPLKSQPFVKQLAQDLLQGLMNMRNPAADPWRVALLKELGEHRRVGNSFTRHDAERYVRAFRERVHAVGGK
jgi:hypothetical protein